MRYSSSQAGALEPNEQMETQEIVFNVERDEDSSVLVASWDDPRGGGITTQGADLRELQEMIRDAAAGYFQAKKAKLPSRVRL